MPHLCRGAAHRESRKIDPLLEDDRDISLEWYPYQTWLVVWNMTFIFPYIGKIHPNWLIFFRGIETTSQTWMISLSDPITIQVAESESDENWCWIYLDIMKVAQESRSPVAAFGMRFWPHTDRRWPEAIWLRRKKSSCSGCVQPPAVKVIPLVLELGKALQNQKFLCFWWFYTMGKYGSTNG